MNYTSENGTPRDDDNIRGPYFDENGLRYSANGKILLSYPEGTSGRVEIPEGVETLAADVLRNCGTITELCIPASMQSLHCDAFKKRNIQRLDVHPDNTVFSTAQGGELLLSQNGIVLMKASCLCQEVNRPARHCYKNWYFFLCTMCQFERCQAQPEHPKAARVGFQGLPVAGAHRLARRTYAHWHRLLRRLLQPKGNTAARKLK